MTVIKHGGARPKQRPDDARGGPRPVSGALKNRFVLSPFQHNERGESISQVSISFTRCNSCGAFGYIVADEYRHAPFQGWNPIDNKQAQPLVHADDCPMKGGE
jgi:hypothetical protein